MYVSHSTYVSHSYILQTAVYMDHQLYAHIYSCIRTLALYIVPCIHIRLHILIDFRTLQDFRTFWGFRTLQEASMKPLPVEVIDRSWKTNSRVCHNKCWTCRTIALTSLSCKTAWVGIDVLFIDQETPGHA